jgi:hypothetical protein
MLMSGALLPNRGAIIPGSKSIGLLALGVDASALEEVFSVREILIRTWLCRGGKRDKKLHGRFMLELDLIHL